VLLDYDIMTHRQAKPGALAGRLGREKRVEDFLPDIRRDSRAVVANAYFDLLLTLRRQSLPKFAVLHTSLRSAMW
jgi:hypothetical protein